MTVPIALRNAAVHLYCNFTRSLRKVVTMLGNQFSKSALHKWLQSAHATHAARG
jgi:transposase-like protein